MLTTDAIELFIDSRKARGDSPHTLKWYRLILSYYAEMYETLPEQPEHVEKFLASCRGGDERRHGFWRTLRAFYRFLFRRHKILYNPIIDIDPPRRKPKIPQILNIEELRHLINSEKDERVQAYIVFLADTGARVGELDNLQPTDFQTTPWGMVTRLDGKTGPRLVPVSQEAYDAVINYLPVPYKTDWLTRHISQAFKEAKLHGTAHTLRHSMATNWEGSEFALQSILGHSNFEMLRRYRNLRMQKISLQHAQFSPLRLIK